MDDGAVGAKTARVRATEMGAPRWPPARTPGREDRAPGWRWRPPRTVAGEYESESPTSSRMAADSAVPPARVRDPSPRARVLRASTAWAPLPESDSTVRQVRLWDPRAWRLVHQVRLDLPGASHGRKELLRKRAGIPRDFVHLRARIGTPLARPYSRPPTKERPWTQRPPTVARDPSATRRTGIQPGDRVRLKAGLEQLKNGGIVPKVPLIAEVTSGMAGKVMDVGPQFGGDVLVEWAGGKKLWFGPDELQIE